MQDACEELYIDLLGKILAEYVDRSNGTMSLYEKVIKILGYLNNNELFREANR